MQHAVGDTLEGRYQVLAELGAGGMGEVYLVDNLRLRRKEALKLLRSDYAEDAQLTQRFLREGRAVGRLNHVNIVSVYDLGQLDDGTLFLTMEVVEGPTVAQEIRRSRGLPLGRALGILKQLARAAHHAHERGVVHRDLKPENMVITRRAASTEVLKVLDFGIAKIVAPDYVSTGLTAEGQLFGTPQYMPPESFRGDATNHRGDLYAIGCIAFELVVGRPPFEGTILQVTVAHMSQPAPEPSASCPTLPPEYDAVVARCLAKQPEERFQTALELLEALDRVPEQDEEQLRRAVVIPQQLASITARASDGIEEDGTEERTFSEDPTQGPGSLAQTGLLSEEDLAPVHQTTVRELCELLLVLHDGHRPLRQLFTELGEAERARASLDAELRALDQASLGIETSFRAAEQELRVAMDRLRDAAEQSGGSSPALARELDGLEEKIASLWSEAEHRTNAVSNQLIDLTAARAAIDDRITALYAGLSVAANEVVAPFAQHPKVAPVVGRLESLNRLMSRASAGRS